MQLIISFLVLTSVCGNNSLPGSGWPFAPTSTGQCLPCTGFNILPNHGYLPCAGINMNVTQIMTAALSGLIHVFRIRRRCDYVRGHEPQYYFAAQFLNFIEHDAYISRNDWGPEGTGDNLHFNQTAFPALANAGEGLLRRDVRG
ncbi:hypothetical protein B0H11DRAFT_2228964 [Mycena galericulata]|nr:hypothetical protein B0H11DRAFT_2228964 [Mycena galericulata]